MISSFIVFEVKYSSYPRGKKRNLYSFISIILLFCFLFLSLIPLLSYKGCFWTTCFSKLDFYWSGWKISFQSNNYLQKLHTSYICIVYLPAKSPFVRYCQFIYTVSLLLARLPATIITQFYTRKRWFCLRLSIV